MLGIGIDMGITACPPAIPPVETQNYSVYLDGASDRVQGGRANAMFQDFIADRNWTLKFSFKLDTLDVSQTISTSGPTSDYIWMGVATDGKLFLYSVTGGTFRLTRVWTAGIAIDTWYEVVITCDASGSQRSLICYVNKVAKTLHTTNVSTSSVSLLPASGKVTWGTFFNLVDHDFRLDTIASWNSVLTSAEVTSIYDSGPDLTADQHGYVSSASLTSYYKFEEGTGSSVADSSGHVGTLALTFINSPSWSSDTRL